jgi:hypothetical protein
MQPNEDGDNSPGDGELRPLELEEDQPYHEGIDEQHYEA